MDKGILENIREQKRADGEFATGTEESIAIEAHFTKRVCLYGAYTVYVMSLLSEQQQKYMRIFLDECPHQRDLELHDYVNSSEDTLFVQMFIMSRAGDVDCVFFDLSDFVATVAASLEEDHEGSLWREWRMHVQNSQDVPEFVMTAVMQLDYDFTTRAFPCLAQNLWRVGTSLADGVKPHHSVLYAMKLFARRVDVGEWYKHAVISRNRQSPGTPCTSPPGTSPMSPSLRSNLPNNASMSLMVQVLAYDCVYNTGKLSHNCPSMFADAPHAFSAACTEIRQNKNQRRLPPDIVEATKGVVNEYKFVGQALSKMERYTNLYTVVTPYVRIPRDEAIAMITDIDPVQANAQSPISHTTAFIVVSGRFLGAEFDMTYQNTNEDGFGGLVAFLGFLDVNARLSSNKFKFKWHQLETGLLLQIPRETLEEFDNGASIFATYVFPAPAHVGHPLYRYGALARMFAYGNGKEVMWAVRTMHYLASGNPDTTMSEINEFDNADEIKYLRGDVPRLMNMLVTGYTGKDDFIEALTGMNTAVLNVFIGIFLSLVLTGRFGKVLNKEKLDIFLNDIVEVEIDFRKSTAPEVRSGILVGVRMLRDTIFSSERANGTVGRPVSEWYVICVVFLIQEAKKGRIHWEGVIKLLQRLDLVMGVSERCEVFDNSYGDVHSSIQYHSRNEHWQCTETTVRDNMEVLNVFYGMCMAVESLNMGISMSHILEFHKYNLGAGLDFSVSGIRFPIFRTYNSLESRVFEREAFVMGRIGDLLDPLTQRSEVLEYYNRPGGGSERMRLHPSVFYACTTWSISDLIANKNKRVPTDSPLTSPTRHLSPFDMEINSIAPTTNPRPFGTKRKFQH